MRRRVCAKDNERVHIGNHPFNMNALKIGRGAVRLTSATKHWQLIGAGTRHGVLAPCGQRVTLHWAKNESLYCAWCNVAEVGA